MTSFLTVAETTFYTRKSEDLLFEEERLSIVDFLSSNPKSGKLIQGTGGIRKLRGLAREWARAVSAMFDELKATLDEAIAHTKGEATGARVREVPRTDVRQVRGRLGLTQAEFACVFGVSVGTVRNWEQHHREPEGPARVLLLVIEREPAAVVRALHLGELRTATG